MASQVVACLIYIRSFVDFQLTFVTSLDYIRVLFWWNTAGWWCHEPARLKYQQRQWLESPKQKCRSSKFCSPTPDGFELWIQFFKSVFSSKMESFIHLFEASSGSGTQTAPASMPECLPPEVNINFLRPFYPHFRPLSQLLLSDLVQVEEGNVEYKVSLSQRFWCCW